LQRRGWAVRWGDIFLTNYFDSESLFSDFLNRAKIKKPASVNFD
jgi:hypothetical protein